MKRSTKKIIKPCVLGLFPVPIYVAFLNRKFSKQEAKTIQKLTLTYVPNQGNDTSKNNYILEVKELKKLKLELENILQDYIKKIYDPVTDIKGYITQSWLNVAKKIGGANIISLAKQHIINWNNKIPINIPFR